MMDWLASLIAALALVIALVHVIDVLMLIIEGRSPLVDLLHILTGRSRSPNARKRGGRMRVTRRRFFRWAGMSILTFGAAPEIIGASRGQGIRASSNVTATGQSGRPEPAAEMGISFPLSFPLHTRPMVQAGHHGYWLGFVPMQGEGS